LKDRSEDAFRRFDTAVPKHASAVLIVSTIQEALTHAAALFRFFWPTNKSGVLATARGIRLRDAFRLNEKVTR
jgi:hypothetical protein